MSTSTRVVTVDAQRGSLEGLELGTTARPVVVATLEVLEAEGDVTQGVMEATVDLVEVVLATSIVMAMGGTTPTPRWTGGATELPTPTCYFLYHPSLLPRLPHPHNHSGLHHAKLTDTETTCVI